MQLNDPSRKDSPELKRLQLPEQNAVRTKLRKFGVILLVAGVVCTVIAGISFFSSMNSFEPPHLIWMGFIGLPLMFFGFMLSSYGYMGAAARYVAGESAPVMADTANYMADETKGAVQTVAKAAATGIVEGIEAGRASAESVFCPYCGASAKSDFKFCPKCGKPLVGA